MAIDDFAHIKPAKAYREGQSVRYAPIGVAKCIAAIINRVDKFVKTLFLVIC